MTIEGTLFQAAALKYQPNKRPGGKPIPVCELTLMADTIIRDFSSGEVSSVPMKHRCIVAGPLAEVTADYCREPGVRVRAESNHMTGHTFVGAMRGTYNKTFFVDAVAVQVGTVWRNLTEVMSPEPVAAEG